jgi:hypothetical protein
MVVVRQTTHGAYILAEMDSAVSKLRFAAFRVIPYHARRKMNIHLETFFVFPDAEEETEGAEDEMEPDEDIQETAGLEEGVPSDEGEFSVLSLRFISLFLSSTKPQLSCMRPPWVSRP